MSIYLFSDHEIHGECSCAEERIFWERECLYCKATLEEFSSESGRIEELFICPCCGWWKYRRDDGQEWGGACRILYYAGNYGKLKNLSQSDIAEPMDDLEKSLIKKDIVPISRPRIFEELVASVFKSAGYNVHLTSYSKDGGIDIILAESADKSIGVQVKRYKNKIGVEQIRAFSGALIHGGFTSGIFVTTSTFTSGAEKAAKITSTRGIPVILYDTKRFFEALGVKPREMYRSFGEWENSIGKISLWPAGLRTQ